MVEQPLPIRYKLAKLPLYPVLWHFSVGSFIGALVTDIAYWKTAEMTWANFSAWLLAAGLATAAVATLVFLMDWLLGRLVGLQRPGWISTLGSVVVVVLAVVNSLVHSRDAWTSVVPLGLALSAATVVVIIFTGIIQRGRTYRYMQGVEA